MIIGALTKFNDEAACISAIFPELSCAENENGHPYIIGTLTLNDKEGNFVDAYSIEIHPSPYYPFRFPIVYEKGGRIPLNLDWHIYLPEGNCCLNSAPEEWLQCKSGISLQIFIENEVKPYFFHQSFREKHGYFLQERAHGFKGQVEFFEELLGTKDMNIIANMLLFIAKRNEPDRVSKCFCSSGEKYRHCHRSAFRVLSKFNDTELSQFFDLVTSLRRFLH